MSLPKAFKIKESESGIRKLMKSNIPMIAKRLHALLVFKRHEGTGVSKRAVADETGTNHNSVQAWRSSYVKGGINGLMSHSNTGHRPSKITKGQEGALKTKLGDASNGMVGFNELLGWFNAKFGTAVNYKTFHGFVVRKFGAKIKVARKSHVKKDPVAVAAFKKTSMKPVRASSPKRRGRTKA